MLLLRLQFLIFDAIGDALASLGEMILDGIVKAIKIAVGYIFYFLTIGILKLVQIFYEFFNVFSGISRVEYKGEATYLINVFFDNSSVNKVYWGMALIGIVLVFAFGLAAVIRKLFDVNDKQKDSYGQIIINCGKSILVILLMSTIMNVTLSATNILLQRINYLFNTSQTGSIPTKKTFTNEEYAVMNDALEVIGNYAINPSYSSRYNINSCFNEIRSDLLYLQEHNVFDYNYYPATGSQSTASDYTWQLMLQSIAKAHNPDADLKMDIYYDSVSKAILEAMDLIRNNPDFRPVQSVSTEYRSQNGTVQMDVILFLTGTAEAAQNSFYNRSASIFDAVRGPYYSGDKSIYNVGSVSDDFKIEIGGISYIVIILLSVLMIWQLCVCILTCAVRIFNMMLLYIVAPPFAATIPYDEGARFKQWVQAFVVQSLSVFGTVIVMRLLILYIPIILSSDLVLFDNSFMNLCGKVILIYAGIVAASRGADLISGILTGNGAGAAAGAGNMNKQGLSMAAGFGGALGAISGATAAKDAAAKKVGSVLGKGGLLVGSIREGYDDVAKQKKEAQEEEKQHADNVHQNKMNSVADKLGAFLDSQNGGNKAGGSSVKAGTNTGSDSGSIPNQASISGEPDSTAGTPDSTAGTEAGTGVTNNSTVPTKNAGTGTNANKTPTKQVPTKNSSANVSKKQAQYDNLFGPGAYNKYQEKMSGGGNDSVPTKNSDIAVEPVTVESGDSTVAQESVQSVSDNVFTDQSNTADTQTVSSAPMGNIADVQGSVVNPQTVITGIQSNVTGIQNNVAGPTKNVPLKGSQGNKNGYDPFHGIKKKK